MRDQANTDQTTAKRRHYNVIVRYVSEYSYVIASANEREAVAIAKEMAEGDGGRQHDYTETVCLPAPDCKS